MLQSKSTTQTKILLLLLCLNSFISCHKKDTLLETITVKGEGQGSSLLNLQTDLEEGVPHIYIDTENNSPIDSKENYLSATLTIDGKKKYKDFTGKTKIRGRGNSTWYYPKKPYRIKLNSKASLFDLPAEKNWVLLANYLDETHLLNAVALKIGKLMQMPFTNNIIPVEVTLNGEYQGCYMFTEQVEVGSNRVNVGEDGLLLNLDTQYEDPWQFISSTFNLPVLVKYPDLKNNSKISKRNLYIWNP
jgi:hypothetical protein